jgi:hypothetical protein
MNPNAAREARQLAGLSPLLHFPYRPLFGRSAGSRAKEISRSFDTPLTRAFDTESA